LAPFYDLLSVASYDTPAFDKKGWPAQTQLAWPILGARHFSGIDRALLLDAGAALNLARNTAMRLLENLRSRIAKEAETLYAEVEAENAVITRERPILSATMAGESRCLRAILHTVIKEMTKRLA
jgi:serine/threonine-protein kinase HipA